MRRSTYVHWEMVRNFRNKRYLFFSLLWPLVLYLTIAGSSRRSHFDGVSFPLYFMTGMAAFGSMVAVVSIGGRIAVERAVGWTKQIRISPLSVGTYFTSKMLCAYVMAFITIAGICLAGTALGVRLSFTEWATVLGLLLVGLVPFALLGIGLGHLVSADSLTPAVGGIVTLFALLGGSYGFLIAKSGVLFDVIKGLPSYWLVQAGKTAFKGNVWPIEGWVVVAIWSVALAPLAVLAYRHDNSQV